MGKNMSFNFVNEHNISGLDTSALVDDQANLSAILPKATMDTSQDDNDISVEVKLFGNLKG